MSKRKQFSHRERFNWGFHDGVDMEARGVTAGWASPHFDRQYEAGYWAGRKAQREGAPTESSDAAWIAAGLAEGGL